MIDSDWPERARDAAAVLSPRDVESIGPMLLADIKAAFDEQAVDRLSSADICVALNNMEGKPWGDWKGKELTPNQLARLLKPFRIKSDNIRIGSKVPKGYYRRQFEEAWQRYLDPEGVPEPQQRYNPDEMGTSCTFQNATAETHVALQKCEKPAPNGHCSVVTFPKGVTRGMGLYVPNVAVTATFTKRGTATARRCCTRPARTHGDQLRMVTTWTFRRSLIGVQSWFHDRSRSRLSSMLYKAAAH